MAAVSGQRTYTRITQQQAARIAIAAQLGHAPPANSASVLRLLGLLQLDPLQPVTKAHRLTSLTRLGAAAHESEIDEHLWATGRATSFETWVHAACLVPVEDWPLFRLSRERSRAASWQPPRSVLLDVLSVIADTDGGAVIGDIERSGAASKGWDWSERKRAVEYLLRCGHVVCSARRASKRVYHLAEHRLPVALIEATLSDTEILSEIARKALRAMGIATAHDIATYYNLTQHDTQIGLDTVHAIPVQVDGWAQLGWVLAPPADLDNSVPDHPLLIGPFDNLIWDRPRARRIFGFDYTFDAYKPVVMRQYGYYVMGVLHHGQFVGRVDLKRRSGTVEVLAAQPEGQASRADFFHALSEAVARLQAQVAPLQ